MVNPSFSYAVHVSLALGLEPAQPFVEQTCLASSDAEVCAGTAEEQRLIMPHMPNVHSSLGHSPPTLVVGFGKMVDVFSSKQRPKKLTIYGDDFRY